VVPGELALSDRGRLPGDLYLWPARKSYTREPAAEFHTLGSPPLLSEAVAALCAAGARLAEPGEFTLRAFLAGRLDLTQAEAVLGVIDAASSTELGVALSQLAGGLAAPLGNLRDELLDLLARLEAGLDFVEEDIEFISREQLLAQLSAAAGETARLAEQMTARGAAAGEVRVALVGWPNVGKSSLVNALAGRQAAIVSPQAGTTRDYLVQRANLAGLDCLLVDTAGIDRQAGSLPYVDEAAVAEAASFGRASVESSAQKMTARQQASAHLALFCLDSTRPLNSWERETLAAEQDDRRLVVLTKCDLPPATDYPGPALATSSRTGAGLAELARAIRERISASPAGEAQVVVGTADRCRESLRLASESLARAQSLAASAAGEELVSAEIRLALDELGKVVGAVYTDDILDRIFSRFCIGK
jgi:tRNA modification GTPase